MSDRIRGYALIAVVALVVTGMIVPSMGAQATDGTERAGTDKRLEYGTADDQENGSAVTHPFGANKTAANTMINQQVRRVQATGASATENATNGSELGLDKPAHDPPTNRSDDADDSEDSDDADDSEDSDDADDSEDSDDADDSEDSDDADDSEDSDDADDSEDSDDADDSEDSDDADDSEDSDDADDSEDSDDADDSEDSDDADDSEDSDDADDSEDSAGGETEATVNRSDADQQAGDDDPFEPNDEFGSATGLSGESGTTELTGRTTGGAQDVFVINLTAGEQIDVEVLFDHDEADIDLALYGPDREPVTSSTSITDDEAASYVASQSGRHYVEVYGFSGGPAEYTLRVVTSEADLEPDRFEPNDNIGAAAVLGAEMYSDLTLVGDDIDVYTVDLERGQNLQTDVAFNHDRADLNVIVLGPDRTQIAAADSRTDGESVTLRDVPQSGQYYLVVLSRNGNGVRYDLSIEIDANGSNDRFEPNDALETAAQIQAGTIEARIAGGDDPDIYRTTVDPGTGLSASISFDHDQNDLDLFLLNEDERIIDRSVSVSDGERVSAANLGGGTYYIVVSPLDSTPTDYVLTLEREAEDDPAQDRFEPNDRPETATPIDPGTYEGLTLPAGDLDAYQLDLPAGQSFEATLFPDEPLEEPTRVRFDLFYQSSQGSGPVQIAGSFATGTSSQIEIGELDRDGTYFIVVYNEPTGDASRPVEYELEVGVGETIDENDRFEPNDQVSTAAPIDAGTYDELRLVPGEIDAYTIERAAGESVDVTVFPDEPLDSGAVSVQLYYQTGRGSVTNVTDPRLVAGTETSLEIGAVERSGTYHVVLFSSTDLVVDYRLAVDSPADDDRTGPVDARLRPASGDGSATGPIPRGTTRTYEIITTNVTRGLGAYEFVVEADDPGVATITDLTPRGLTDRSIVDTSVASDGATATVIASNTDTGIGTVVAAEVTVRGETPGSTALDLRLRDGNPPGNENGNSYTVGTVSGTDITVSEQTGPGDITGNGAPATDPDGDGVYEDVNGDGSVSAADVTALFGLLVDGEVPDDGSQLDINEASDGVTAADVTALFDEVVSG